MTNAENKVIAFIKTLGFSYDVANDVYAKPVKVYKKFLGFIPIILEEFKNQQITEEFLTEILTAKGISLDSVV